MHDEQAFAEFGLVPVIGHLRQVHGEPLSVAGGNFDALISKFHVGMDVSGVRGWEANRAGRESQIFWAVAWSTN